jgi:hypothetical protein
MKRAKITGKIIFLAHHLLLPCGIRNADTVKHAKIAGKIIFLAHPSALAMWCLLKKMKRVTK